MALPLWAPSPERIQSARMTRFMQTINERYQTDFSTYHELYEWSINNVEQFWEAVFREAKPIHSSPYQSVLSKRTMPGAQWFPGCRLNFAQNLLKYRDNKTAIISYTEEREPSCLSYAELYAQVAACSASLRRLGVETGDRVAGFLPNIPQAVIAMLATTSLGAIWSSCSPDFGIQGALDRFGQITPKVLITVDGYRYNGKPYDSLERVREIGRQIPEIDNIAIIRHVTDSHNLKKPTEMLWSDLLIADAPDITFAQLPFDHPVYILYSSGTTGIPKCIVHGAGGTLLQHFKEHALHTNINRDEVVTYYTTCGWMMWNWLVSALSLGATIVLYDGSPAYPDIDVLWKIVEKERISVFGTSPRFLSTCQQRGYVPSEDCDLKSLEVILSTGAPLSDENFRWVYENVKKDVQLSSISGGTDIVSCFMLGNPILPVYAGEIQCRGLGMKVEVYDDVGNSLSDKIGELVCTAPFPSMPVRFWNDPDRKKYHAAYFEHFPGVWRHGDYIRITAHDGVIVYGRSDATLNPGGVRIGTAEIYGPVEAMGEVIDSVVVGQQWDNDIRIILFVVLAKNIRLEDNLKEKIRKTIRTKATPRHVPARIIQVRDIPHTINGKKVEIAVSRVIHGKEVLNRDALANPDALDQFTNLAELQD